MSKYKHMPVKHDSWLFKQAIKSVHDLLLYPGNKPPFVMKTQEEFSAASKDFADIGYNSYEGKTTWLATSLEGRWVWKNANIAWLKKKASEDRQHDKIKKIQEGE